MSFLTAEEGSLDAGRTSIVDIVGEGIGYALKNVREMTPSLCLLALASCFPLSTTSHVSSLLDTCMTDAAGSSSTCTTMNVNNAQGRKVGL